MDGSGSEGKYTAAVVTKENDESLTRISIPVDGGPKDFTSYQSGFSFINGGYLHLEQHIPRPLRGKLIGKILSNSDSLLQKLISLPNTVPGFIKQSYPTKILLFLEIISKQIRFPGVTIHWISSHQNNNMEETKLNNIADDVAD